jgi:hypothetical protein
MCPTRMLDRKLCQGGETYRYRYSVMDSDSNEVTAEREVVVEEEIATVSSSVLFQNTAWTAHSKMWDGERQRWLSPSAAGGQSTMEAALTEVLAARLTPAYIPGDIHVDGIDVVLHNGTWSLRVNCSVTITDRHINVPWYEVTQYVDDIWSSVMATPLVAAKRQLKGAAADVSFETSHKSLLPGRTWRRLQMDTDKYVLAAGDIARVESLFIRLRTSGDADFRQQVVQEYAEAVKQKQSVTTIYTQMAGSTPKLVTQAAPSLTAAELTEQNLLQTLSSLTEGMVAQLARLPLLSDQLWDISCAAHAVPCVPRLFAWLADA